MLVLCPKRLVVSYFEEVVQMSSEGEVEAEESTARLSAVKGEHTFLQPKKKIVAV